MKLTDTQRSILTAAAEHPEHLAYPPERLPAAPRQAVAKALLKGDLVIAVHRPAYDAQAKWTVDGEETVLKITDEGLRAIGRTAVDEMELGGLSEAEYEAEQDLAQRAMDAGIDLTAEDAAEQVAALGLANDAPAATPAPRATLREAAQRVLDAWDDEENQRYDLGSAIDALRQVLTKPARPAREPGAPRKPREGTKQEQVLAMLRRPEGAAVAQIAEATGWAAHTVRGFFAGLKKKGHAVEVLERVRQVGPNKEGARGSYTVYHLPA